MTENTGLSDIEMNIREQLRKGGLVGPDETTTKPTVRKASTLTGGQTENPTPMPEIIQRGSAEAARFSAADRSEPTLEDGLSRAAIATKPQLAVKEKVVDDRFLALEDLPSNFYPYGDMKRILIRPFAVNELKLVARSIETGDADYIAQAIDNCIDMPVANLTIPDYFYLYYWMRIQSYPNTPHYMEWQCDEEKSHGECGYENVTPLTHKELKVIYLNDLGFKSEDLDQRLDFPRVSLLQDLTLAQESKTAIKENRNADATFSLDDLVLVNAAKWIKEGATLRDKIAILEAQPDLELYEVASKTNKAFEYGVYEYATVSCGRCGAKRRYRVLLDAPRFFPFAD